MTADAGKNRKLAIVNRDCCRSSRGGDADILAEKLEKHIGARVVFTGHAGEAAEAVGNAKDCSVLIAAGGDGTIAEVVNSMDLENQSLGIIPLGAGNSLARDPRIVSPERALAVLADNNIKQIDLIRCDFTADGKRFNRYAIATTGMGIISKIAAFAERKLRPAGKYRYFLAACMNLFKYPSVSAEMQIDDMPSIKTDFTAFAVNNTVSSGNFCIFPDADMGDALMNVGFAKAGVVMGCIAFISILTHTHFYDPGVRVKAKTLSMYLDKPDLLMLDGDIFGPVDRVEYTIAPKRLKILN